MLEIEPVTKDKEKHLGHYTLSFFSDSKRFNRQMRGKLKLTELFFTSVFDLEFVLIIIGTPAAARATVEAV
jgi:hypothetical protein